MFTLQLFAILQMTKQTWKIAIFEETFRLLVTSLQTLYNWTLKSLKNLKHPKSL